MAARASWRAARARSEPASAFRERSGPRPSSARARSGIAGAPRRAIAAIVRATASGDDPGSTSRSTRWPLVRGLLRPSGCRRGGPAGQIGLGGGGEPLQERAERGGGEGRVQGLEGVEDHDAQAGVFPLVEDPRRQRVEGLDRSRRLEAHERQCRVPPARTPGPDPSGWRRGRGRPGGRHGQRPPRPRGGPRHRPRPAPGRGCAGEPRAPRSPRAPRAPRGARRERRRRGTTPGAREPAPRGASGRPRRSRALPPRRRRACPPAAVCARSAMVRSAR